LHARNSARKNKVEKEKKGRREQKKQKIKSTKSSPEFHSKSKWAIKCLEYSLQQRGGGPQEIKARADHPPSPCRAEDSKKVQIAEQKCKCGIIGLPQNKTAK
jgi:hypothetical protein